MRIIRGEDDRVIIAVKDLNDKVEAADKGGYARGWAESRNQLRAVLKTVAEQEVAAKISEALKLAD